MTTTSRNNASPPWLPKLLSLLRIAVGLLFVEHGLSTAFGFATGRADVDFSKLHAWAGPIETIGGVLLILGLFTRTTGFILCGEMAVAYFTSRLRWAEPNAVFFPTRNNGEEAVLNCFFFLWLMTAGGGAWSLDALIAKSRRKSNTAVGAAGEPVRAQP
jgi:putative oxidoreductase